MPASTVDLFYMQEARNNFEAIRPAPICADANQLLGQCHNVVHISTNCYYGYHEATPAERKNENPVDDCEMREMHNYNQEIETVAPLSNARKRSADIADFPQVKRLKEEVQIKKQMEPETNESVTSRKEDLLESLYWNIHGDCSKCSRVGTRSSPIHSASAFNVNIISIFVNCWQKYVQKYCKSLVC